MAKKTPKPTYQHFASDDESFCIYEVFKKAKKTIYHVRGTQAKYIEHVILDGFEGLPIGLYLYKNGYGFGRKGVFLLQALRDNLSYGKKIELIISNRKKKTVVRKSGITEIILTYEDVKSLLGKLGRINEECNIEIRETVGSFLTSKFPQRVNIAPGNFDEYQGGDIAASLSRKNVVKKMTDEDFAAIRSFFPKLIGESLKGRKKSVQVERLGLLRDTRKVADRIYLDEVIEEFERNLSKKTLSEGSWQKFLRDKVLPFLAGYGTTIEKENVSIGVSYPDFVMADVYGFIDVFGDAWMATNKGMMAGPTAGVGKTKRVTMQGAADAKNDVMLYSIVQGESQEEIAKAFVGHPHLEIPGAWIDVSAVNYLPGMEAA